MVGGYLERLLFAGTLAYAVSYFFTSQVWVYLLMRRASDATDFADYEPEPEPAAPGADPLLSAEVLDGGGRWSRRGSRAFSGGRQPPRRSRNRNKRGLTPPAKRERMRCFCVIWWTVLVAALAACGGSSDPPADAGRRIVTLSPVVTQVLIELGLGDEIVAVGDLDPLAPAGVPSVGAWWTWTSSGC